MRVDLHQGPQGDRWAILRPLNGHDEIGLDAGQHDAGFRLLERLLTGWRDQGTGPDDLRQLDVADRDRIYAALYTAWFGDHINVIATCDSCREDYEFGFTLSEVTTPPTGSAAPLVAGPDKDGYFHSDKHIQFRLPTMADLDAVSGLPEDRAVDTLLRRCVVTGKKAIDAAAVQEAMEQLAPLCNLDIQTRCPSCEAPQSVAFSLERFLVQALAQERRFLTLEVHRLARAYGWSLCDILSLGREDRRALVRQVELERAAGLLR